MKRLLVVLSAFIFLLGGISGADVSHASLVPVKHKVQKHKAHKAGKHKTPKRSHRYV